MSEAAVQHSIQVYFDLFFSVKERKDEVDSEPKKQQVLPCPSVLPHVPLSSPRILIPVTV